jgi:hypothetical protein
LRDAARCEHFTQTSARARNSAIACSLACRSAGETEIETGVEDTAEGFAAD